VCINVHFYFLFFIFLLRCSPRTPSTRRKGKGKGKQAQKSRQEAHQEEDSQSDGSHNGSDHSPARKKKAVHTPPDPKQAQRVKTPGASGPSTSRSRTERSPSLERSASGASLTSPNVSVQMSEQDQQKVRKHQMPLMNFSVN
jgi:hypothetical protein